MTNPGLPLYDVPRSGTSEKEDAADAAAPTFPVNPDTANVCTHLPGCDSFADLLKSSDFRFLQYARLLASTDRLSQR